MTPAQIAALTPAFTAYLQMFFFCCDYVATFYLLTVYCRGLLSDLKRKTCEPIALEAGIAVRTLQEFLKDHLWSYQETRTTHQHYVATDLPNHTTDDLGTIGLIDETGTVKKGTLTPGVQRQWCGERGKKENCIVTVHFGVARGRFKTLVDADLFLPEVWDKDRERCKAAGIPDDLHHRPKWRIALEQFDRARANGITVDWLTFDEGYGAVPAFLTDVDSRHQLFVGEVPKSFRCFARWPRRRQAGRRADNLVRHSPTFTNQRWRRFRLQRQTLGPQEWDVKAGQVWLSLAGEPSGRTYWLIWAKNVRTGEEKYFVSNAPPRTALGRLLRVAFSRWNVEHCFRVCKSEIGFRHFEGRNYVALMRHMVLCCVTLTFVAGQTDRLRGEKSRGDAGAGVPGTEPTVCGVVGGLAGDEPVGQRFGGHFLSPAA